MGRKTKCPKCMQCNNLTTGKRFVKKRGYLIIGLVGLLPYIMASIHKVFAQLGPDYDPIFYDVVLYGFSFTFFCIL